MSLLGLRLITRNGLVQTTRLVPRSSRSPISRGPPLSLSLAISSLEIGCLPNGRITIIDGSYQNSYFFLFHSLSKKLPAVKISLRAKLAERSLYLFGISWKIVKFLPADRCDSFGEGRRLRDESTDCRNVFRSQIFAKGGSV